MIVVLDKPAGPTSADVVARVKRLLGRNKKFELGHDHRHGPRVGHTGTLDPMASGVLPIVVGQATKLAPLLINADKQYRATLQFGAETDTQDAQGRTTGTFPVSHLDLDAVRKAGRNFTGRITQIPPLYAALKVGGRPLHRYARAGAEVERKARVVEVHHLEVLSFDVAAMTADIFVHCSKGTYVRTLVADLGRALGSGAHLRALRRLASGPFRLEHATTLDDLAERTRHGEPWPQFAPRALLSGMTVLSAAPELAHRIFHGQPVAWSEVEKLLLGPKGMNVGAAEGPAALVDEHQRLVALVERSGDRLRVVRGFSPPLALDVE